MREETDGRAKDELDGDISWKPMKIRGDSLTSNKFDDLCLIHGGHVVPRPSKETGAPHRQLASGAAPFRHQLVGRFGEAWRRRVPSCPPPRQNQGGRCSWALGESDRAKDDVGTRWENLFCFFSPQLRADGFGSRPRLPKVPYLHSLDVSN